MTAVTEREEAVDTEAAEAPTERQGDGGPLIITYETLTVISILLAGIAVIVAVFAMGLANRAMDERNSTAPASSSSAQDVAVTLKEFTISTAPVTMAAGSKLKVTNSGSVAHNVTVEGLATPDIAAGESAVLDTSKLEAGTYTIYCAVAGHREAGMETKLTVT